MEWGVEIRDHFQHVQRIDDDKDQKSSLLPRFDEHTDLGNENDTNKELSLFKEEDKSLSRSQPSIQGCFNIILDEILIIGHMFFRLGKSC